MNSELFYFLFEQLILANFPYIFKVSGELAPQTFYDGNHFSIFEKSADLRKYWISLQ